jgi:uncharacterized protein with NRDE domain
VCTLIAIHRRVQGAPLIIAANRDEYFDRPSEGPAIRRNADGAVLAPIDLRAGGTWLGANAQGVFSAVTNLRNDSPDPSRRSRGMVVMEALQEPTAARAADWLKTLPEEAYNPFHCLVADADRAFHLVYRDRPRIQELAPGVHVIGNVDPAEEPAPKADRIAKQVEEIADFSEEDALEALAEICRGHETGGGITDICVHTGLDGMGPYGTRSSALLVMTGETERNRLLYSDGPPCENDYQDLSTLFRDLC